MPKGKRLWRTEDGDLVPDGHLDARVLAYGVDDELADEDKRKVRVIPSPEEQAEAAAKEAAEAAAKEAAEAAAKEAAEAAEAAKSEAPVTPKSRAAATPKK